MDFRTGLLSAVLSVGMMFSLLAMDGEAPAGGGDAAGVNFADRMKNSFNNSGQVLASNIQVVHLARALSHIPYIATVDSHDPTNIKTAAMLAASSTTFKILYERLRKIEDYRLIYNLYHEPKLFCYLLAAAYDVMRFLGAPEIALKNEEEGRSMRGFKINQTIQLAIEICLRFVAFMSDKSLVGGIAAATPVAGSIDSSYSVSLCASEVADWVELWRLLSRYTTYMSVSKVEANFNISVKKDETNNHDETLRLGGSINSDSGVDFELENEPEATAQSR